MIILWARQALKDRVSIWEYIATDDLDAAARTDIAFSVAVSRLTDHPELGRPGIVAGTREIFPLQQYRIVYEIMGEQVWILTLVHTSQRWPRSHE